MHIFVDVTQIVAPRDVARAQKSISSNELFKVFPKSKQFYVRWGILWSRGYFVSTVIKIKEQKNDNW